MLGDGILIRQLRLTVGCHKQEPQGTRGIKVIHLLYIIRNLLDFRCGNVVRQRKHRLNLDREIAVLHPALYPLGSILLLDSGIIVNSKERCKTCGHLLLSLLFVRPRSACIRIHISPLLGRNRLARQCHSLVVVALGLRALTHQPVILTPYKVCARERRELRYHSVKIGIRPRIIGNLFGKQRTVVHSLVVIRIKSKHFSKIVDGLVVVVDFGTQKPAVEQRRYARRIKLYGIIEVGHSPEIIVKLITQERTVYKVSRKLWLQLYRLIHIGASTGIVFCGIDSDIGTHHVSIDVVLVDLKRMIYVGTGLHRVAHGEIKPGASYQTVVVTGMETQQLGIRLLRFLILLQLFQSQCLVEEQPAILRQLLERAVVILNGFFKFAEILTRHTAHLIRPGDKPVVGDSRRSVVLGADIVFKRYFGDRTIEIRLCEIRLYGDHLIEILYRKHIILKIKRILSDTHHLVGIYLSRGLSAK